jgi:serine/threonine-protein kinase
MISNGTFLGNRYEIIEKIGAGGMSDVYRAKDHSLGRDVAIKVLKSEFADDAGFVTKFRAEAQSAAALEHPNIVNIYDVGSEDGLYYIVMEYVEGITLKTYISKKGRLGFNEVLSIAIQVGRGIEAAHNKGIVHRDIKPQNIIISKEGKVKVTDFGIARAATSNTIHADIMGSVHYSSPEQARNGYVTYQSDIYSLGIVMYEMCTGRVPFDGDTTVAVAIQHLQSEMTPPSKIVPDIPVAVEQIIKKATMKSPDRRYASIGDLLSDLKMALVNPNDNFVVIPEIGEVDRTKVITPDEVAQIQKAAAAPVVSEKVNVSAPEPDEDDEDDGVVNPKLDKAITIMGVVVAVVIVLILVYVVGGFLGLWRYVPSGSKSGEDTEVVSEDEGVEVPDLLGMTEEEAKAALKELELGYKKIGEVSSDEYEAGQICQQSHGGETVEKNMTIEVMISNGKGDIQVPDVVGKDLETAITLLRDAGFNYNPTYEFSEDVPQGKIISQSPEAGGRGKEGDLITLVVSQGIESVKIPSLSGMTEKEAKKALENASLKLGNVTKESSDSVASGKVISQDPSSGYADAGSSVNIVISTGPEKTYYSFTEEYDPDDYGVDELYIVLKDGNGNTVATWTVKSAKEVNVGDIETASGKIYIYDNDDHDTLLTGEESVSFDKQ